MDSLIRMADTGYIHKDFIGLLNTLLKEHKITVGEKNAFLSGRKMQLYSEVAELERMISNINMEIFGINRDQPNTAPGEMESCLLSQRKIQLEDQLAKLDGKIEKLNSEIVDILFEQQENGI
jgi:hypothetical protein